MFSIVNVYNWNIQIQKKYLKIKNDEDFWLTSNINQLIQDKIYISIFYWRVRIKKDKYIDTEEVEKVKYSYPYFKRVSNIKIDNIDELEIYDETNHVFVGKSTVVIKGSDIFFLEFVSWHNYDIIE